MKRGDLVQFMDISGDVPLSTGMFLEIEKEWGGPGSHIKICRVLFPDGIKSVSIGNLRPVTTARVHRYLELYRKWSRSAGSDDGPEICDELSGLWGELDEGEAEWVRNYMEDKHGPGWRPV